MLLFLSGDVYCPTLLLKDYIHPVQSIFAWLLVYFRGLDGVLNWHDPALTTWLCALKWHAPEVKRKGEQKC